MNKAFTLIELLVVVLIIGILSAIALPQYQKAVGRTRYVQLHMLTESLAQAQEIYYLANGEYADKFEKLDITVAGELNESGNRVDSENFYCEIDDRVVECISKTMNFETEIWYEHASSSYAGQKWCTSPADLTALESKICKIETNSTAPCHSGLYSYWCY